ncbi:MAG: P-loop NTPase fold protein [Pseudomonadota bacterium]
MAARPKKSSTRKNDREERQSTGVWLFVALEEQQGANFLKTVEVGGVVPWKHGTDSYTKIMKPGDTAVIYVNTEEGGAQIHGIGTITHPREPFIYDPRPQQNVQRIPIVFLHDFRENPIDLEKIEGDRKIITGQGALFPVPEAAVGALNKQTDLPLPLDPEQCARSVGETRLFEELVSYEHFHIFENYVSAPRRRKEQDAILAGDRRVTDEKQFNGIINRVWTGFERPEPFHNIQDTKSISDNPGTDIKKDYLNRNHMAKVLAARLDIVHESNKNELDVAPFTVLVDAPWGGGKSTFGNFLAHYLKNPDERLEATGSAQTNDERSTGPWIIAEFNAWKHQDVEPSWWLIYQTILEAIGNHDFKENRLNNDLIRLKLWPREYIWRFFTKGTVISLLVIILISIFMYWYVAIEKNVDASSTKTLITTLTSLVSLFGAGGLFFRSIFNSLFPGTPLAARNYALGVSDPLAKFRKHLDATLKRIGYPVLLIIDDIDRCEKSVVTSLVQDLQTVMRSSHLSVLILGERGWIEKSFALEFGEMAGDEESDKERLGRQFVEKALQMSLTLPEPTTDQLNRLFSESLKPPKNLADSSGTARDVKQKSSVSDSGDSVTIDAMNEAAGNGETADSDEVPDVNWEQAFALAEEGNDEKIEHELQPLARLLPPNPRQVKRIINTISFYQAVALGLGEVKPGTPEWRKLAIWIIIMMSHRRAWEKLSVNPELLAEMIAVGSDIEIGETRENAVLAKLLKVKVSDSFAGDESETDLSIQVEDIKRFRSIIPALGAQREMAD